ncbi:hypothetical protein JCM10908_006885 [Rhodotorula pacifica]|uniref:uncharacterized protein n=1 Tax=Rhodotorula pacifica TaxID=1495444 RepID=UPI00317605CE
MHSRIIRSTRVAARAAQASARTVNAPSTAAHLAPRTAPIPQFRLLSASAFVRSDSNSLASSTATEATAAQLSSAAEASTPSTVAEPEQSPAPIDQQHATELPTEEIPAVSSSLDATATEPTSEDAAPPATAAEVKAVAAQPTPEEIAEKVSRTVFIAGLGWSITDEVLIEEVHKHLEAEEGVNQVRIATDPAGRSKGFAFVELASVDLAQQLLSNPSMMLNDREAVIKASNSPIGLAPARGPAAKKYKTARGPNARFPPGPTIYVGNVAWSADEIALEEVFGRYGNIKRINQPKDAETGRSTGVAFVEFEDLDSAQKAFRAGNGRGIRVDGRPVRIDFAKNGSHQEGGERTTSAAGGRTE